MHIPNVYAPPRRIKRIRISAAFLLEFLRGMDARLLYKTDHIPGDAQVVGVTLSERLNTFEIYVESAEFDEVGEGDWVPTWDPAITITSPRIGKRGELIFDAPSEEAAK